MHDSKSAARSLGAARMVAAVVLAAAGAGCYHPEWTAARPVGTPPPEIAAAFAAGQGTISLALESPGRDYRHDPGELDRLFASDENALRFRAGEVRLRPETPTGQVLADLTFTDGAGTRLTLGPVDLLRLTPRIDSRGPLQVPELLLEEYERFGVVFRREHGEFDLAPGRDVPAPARAAAARVYRVGLFNNCLDPTKWELILTSEDRSDFGDRVAADLYLDASKILSHSWFYFDKELYGQLVRLKNPHLEFDPALAWDYPRLAARAAESVVDLAALRTIKLQHRVELLEIGHASGRRIVPVTAEQHYKWNLGLFLDRERAVTYADLTRGPVRLAQFGDRGFYLPDNPRIYDYGWTALLDQVEIASIQQPDSDCYVEIVLSGERLPFRLTLGNLDLAHLDEQRYAAFAFGINPYPKGRRHNPPQNTLSYDTDVIPDRIKPYLLLTDRDSGRWVNNIDQGVEMVYVGWESMDKNVLEIYLLSYERITPIWMARVRVSDEMTDRVRVRRGLYAY